MRDDRFDYDGFERDPDILDILPEDDIEIPGERSNRFDPDEEDDYDPRSNRFDPDEEDDYDLPGNRFDPDEEDDYDLPGNRFDPDEEDDYDPRSNRFDLDEEDDYILRSGQSSWDEDDELNREPFSWAGEDDRQQERFARRTGDSRQKETFAGENENGVQDEESAQAGMTDLQVEEIRWKEAAVKPPKLRTKPDRSKAGSAEKKESAEDLYEDNEDDYEENRRTAQTRSRASSRFLSYILIAAVVAAAVIGVLLLAGRRQYDSYRVLRTERLEDTNTSFYDNIGGSILQYGSDSARLEDRQGREIWSMNYSLKGPKLVANGTTLALYDQGSTGVVVAGKNGKLGEFTTKLPIVKVSVSKQGNVAAILEDGNNAWIEYYTPDGSEIAAIKTSMDNPGYPMGLAVSPNGELLAVSYLNFTGGIQKSEVYVYSFGAAGKNQMDNRIAAFTYEQRIIPELAYLNDGTCVAFRDNGYSLIEGTKVPKISRDVEVEREICSIFYDSEHIGMILVGDQDGSYRMRVSNASGGEILDQAFDFPYVSVEIYGSEISLYNGSAFEVYNMSGTQIFSGSYAGDVKHLFTVGKERYVAVTDAGYELIELC